MRRVKAVIMAGGEGSRLRPLTCDRPKPLVPVCNRPVLAYTLDLLAEHGFQEVFLTLGYMPDAVIEVFGDSYRSMKLHYVVEETPLGTAGGVAALREFLDDTFLVLSGDALTDFDLTALIAQHRETGAVATLALTRVEHPLEYGVVLTDQRGRVRRFLEKPGWGEVFSDTVNTGIYVLEPSVLRGVPAKRMYDFSQHLFPALLEMGAPLFGQVAEGYWCDIGDSAAYLQSNLDLLNKRLRFRPPGREVVSGVWAPAEVPQGLVVDGPALIGEGCRLAPGTRLEAGVVLGPATVTGPNAVLRRTVTWAGVRVGAEATLVGAVVCGGAALEVGSGVYEGAVVGPNCSIGSKATVAPNVRLWPRTEVGDGARVDCTLTQSPLWTGRVLRRGSMGGRLGADLFPENAVRVGTAYAGVLPPGGPVVIGGDPGPAATLLKQALICGALAAGRRVIDTGISASPVTEFAIVRRQAAGGMHVRADGEQANVIFYDGQGRPAGRDLQRKLEQACARQDFPRATPEGAGVAEPFTQAEWLYLEHLGEQVNLEAIRAAGIGVEVDGPAWPVLYRWFERLRCRPFGSTRKLRVKVDLLAGAWSVAGLRSEAMLALEVWLHAGLRGGDTAVPIPVTAPRGLEDLLKRSGRRPVRIRQADWRNGDPLLGIARLLEWMALDNLTIDDVLGRLPNDAMVVRKVTCPWESKGRVMRRLLEEHSDSAVDMVDGLRIHHAKGWALVLPDPDEPVYHIYSESPDPQEAEGLAEHYARRLQELLMT